MFISFFSHTCTYMYVCICMCYTRRKVQIFYYTRRNFFTHTHPNNHPTERFNFNYYPTELFYFNYYPTECPKIHYHPTERPPEKCEKDKPGGKTSTKIYGCLPQRAATFRRVFYRRRRAEALSAGFTIEEPPLLSYAQHRSC